MSDRERERNRARCPEVTPMDLQTPTIIPFENIKFKDRIFVEIRGYGPFAALHVVEDIRKGADKIILTNGYGCVGSLRISRYGTGWRAWTTEPTQHFMEVTPWQTPAT